MPWWCYYWIYYSCVHLRTINFPLLDYSFDGSHAWNPQLLRSLFRQPSPTSACTSYRVDPYHTDQDLTRCRSSSENIIDGNIYFLEESLNPHRIQKIYWYRWFRCHLKGHIILFCNSITFSCYVIKKTCTPHDSFNNLETLRPSYFLKVGCFVKILHWSIIKHTICMGTCFGLRSSLILYTLVHIQRSNLHTERHKSV